MEHPGSDLPTALFVLFLFGLVIYFIAKSGNKKRRSYKPRQPSRSKVEININK
jgi:hypothetical protein